MPDAVDMRACDAILRVDGRGQRGDDRLVELVQLLDVRHVPFHLVRVQVETIHVEPVRGVDQIHRRQEQQRPGVELPVRFVDPHGGRRRGEIAGCGPEKILLPDRHPRQFLLERDGDRDPQRVDGEVDRGEYDETENENGSQP